MKLLVIFIILLTQVFASTKNEVDPMVILGIKYKNISKQYIKTLPVKTNNPIYYGDKNFGLFKVIPSNNKISLIPPFYNKPLNFYTKESNNKYKLLFQKTYKNPTPSFMKKNITFKQEGEINTNFFLLTFNISQHNKKKKVFEYVVVINKWQEIVWAHLINKGRENNSPKYILMKKSKYFFTIIQRYKKGKINLTRTNNSILEEVSFNGSILNSINFLEDLNFKKSVHHDFVYDKPNEILFFTSDYKYHRNNLLDLQKIKGDSIYRLNTSNKTIEHEWDSFNVFFPKNKIKNRNDFTHMNSLSKKDDKYILSSRTQNSIIILDKNFKFIKGYGDYFESPQIFSSQHHITPIGDNFLLFNNGGKSSHSLLLDNDFKIIRKYEEKNKQLISRTRCSVDKVENNIVAYYIHPTIKTKENKKEKFSGVLIEFDFHSGNEVGRLFINDKENSPQYRAIAFKEFYNKYVGVMK